MDPRVSTARRIGLLYLVMALGAIFNEFFLSAGFVVPDDPTATLRNIAGAELTFRLGIVVSFLNLMIFIVLVTALHRLFREVDRSHAMAMVLFVVLGVGVSLAGLMLKFSPLVLMKETAYHSVFTGSQLEALAFDLLRIRGAGSVIAGAFWGLWLFPFGILVIRSGFLPRILGYLLLVAGVGYLTDSLTSMLIPEAKKAFASWLMPLYFGEIPIIFWLAIRGVKPRAHQPPLP